MRKSKVTRTCKVAVGTVNGKRVLQPEMSADTMLRTYTNLDIPVTDVHEEEIIYECYLEDFLKIATISTRTPKEKKEN